MLWTLFWTMFRIGAFTFGGGYAMIALVQSEVCEKRGWLSEEEFMDMIAISESTPGPIAVNMATYVGYRLGGVVASVVATVAICLPSFIIIYLISLFFDAFLALTVVARAFRGIRVCVSYLILSAGVKMIRSLKKDAFHAVLLALSLGAMVVLTLLSVKYSSILFILAGGLVGFLFDRVARMKKGGEENV